MKKILSIVILMLAITITGCSSESSKEDDSLDILTLTFSTYDWINEIVGDSDTNLKYDFLVDTGVDVYSYVPNMSDVVKIKSAKVIIVNESEAESFIYSYVDKTQQVIALIDYLPIDQKIIRESIGLDSCCVTHLYDEHVWLSLKNVMLFVEELTDLVISFDEENESDYISNSESYIAQLDELDKLYEQTVEESSEEMIIFVDSIPFAYLVKDYDIDYYTPYTSCNSDAEITVAKIQALIQKTEELEVSFLITLTNYDSSILNTVIRESNIDDIEILTLNSLQFVSRSDVNNGLKYLNVMKQNLEVFKKALA